MPSSRLKTALVRLAPIAGLAVICVLFYWKLALSDEYVWFDHPDMCYIEIPRLQFQASEIHTGRFPLWDPNIWMGQPLIGQTQPGPLFPLNLLFFLLPLDESRYIRFSHLNWYFVLIHFLAALCAYALCRDLGRSRAASLFAGCAFAFAGFMGTVAWLDVINGAIWTPAICLFFLRAVRGVRPWASSALAGLFLGIAWLSGHHEIPMLVSYALAIATLYAAWKRGVRATLPAAALFVIAGLVAAAQLWPTAEFARLSERWIGLDRSLGWKDAIPYVSPTGYSLPVRGLLGAVLRDTSFADAAPFLGVVIIALSAIGIATCWRAAPVKWMTVLSIAAAIYALGALTPIHGWLFSFAPLLGKARIPARAIHLMNFGLVVLAAYGFDRVYRGAVPVWSRRVSIVLAALAALIFAAAVWKHDVADTVIWSAFIGVALALLLRSRSRLTSVTCAVALGSMMLLELYPAVTATFASKYDKDRFQFVRTLTDNRDIVEFLRREPFPRRIAVNDTEIPTNFGDWNGFNALEGYVAGVSSNLLRYGRHTKPVQDLYGVTHYIARQTDRPGVVEAFTGASGIKVFRNPNALPRAWAVHAAESVGKPEELGPRIDSPGFDPRRTALFLGVAPALESCDGDQVEVLAYAPNRIRLRAAMKCRGVVVLSETFYPGWQARIDGRESPILETYGTLRGVIVDGGEHAIDVVYKPASVYRGAALTATGLGAVAVIVLGSLVRRRKTPEDRISRAGQQQLQRHEA